MPARLWVCWAAAGSTPRGPSLVRAETPDSFCSHLPGVRTAGGEGTPRTPRCNSGTALVYAKMSASKSSSVVRSSPSVESSRPSRA